MGKKRQHPDSESSANDHEGIARKRPRPNHRHHARGQKAVDDSLNAIKKRVRDIERLLARENLKLPANKQNDLERELAAHKQRLADAQAKKARSKMIHKYHMVRFFERKKAMRFAKQLEKRLAQATDPDEVSQLEADLHVAQVDIDYAKYFPFMEPYISLYAKAAPGGADEKSTAAHYLRSPRPPMWTLVEKIREEGITALERLQNRQPGRSSGSTALPQQPKQGDRAKPSRPPSKEAKEGTSPRNARLSRSKPAKIDQEASEAGGHEESSDSDGGGFFEEE